LSLKRLFVLRNAGRQNPNPVQRPDRRDEGEEVEETLRGDLKEREEVENRKKENSFGMYNPFEVRNRVFEQCELDSFFKVDVK
jgi:hypothetical protein